MLPLLMRILVSLALVSLSMLPSPASAGTLVQASWSASSYVTSSSNATYAWQAKTVASASLARLTAGVPAGTGPASGTPWLSSPGERDDYAITGDSPQVSITGTIDIRIDAALDDWANGSYQRIVSKWGPPQMSYVAELDPTGHPQITFSPDGTTQYSIGSPLTLPFADGQRGWWRVVFAPNNGASGRTATFYTSTDGQSWSMLGSPNTQFGALSIYDGTASVYLMGSVGTFGNTAGNLYLLEIRNGEDGPVAARFDPSESAAPYNSWASSNGETWTITQSGNRTADLVASLPTATVSGLPSAGATYLRLLDRVVDYRFSPTMISSGTPISISASGLRNTAVAGTYTSLISLYATVASATPTDSVTPANAISLSSGSATPTWATSSAVPGDPASYTWSHQTSAETISRVNYNVAPTVTSSGARSLVLPHASTNNASTPDSVAASITGDIDIRAHLNLDQWSGSPADRTIVGKWGNDSNNRSYMLRVSTLGRLRLFWSTDGNASVSASSTTSVSFADGSAGWVRATLDVAGAPGRVARFYTSTDGVTWSQLGSPVTGADTSIYDSTAATFVGATNGSSEPVYGQIYKVDILSGIGGTLASSFDPSLATAPYVTVPSAVAGETWTLNRSGPDPAAIAADLSVASSTGTPSGRAYLKLTDAVVGHRFASTTFSGATTIGVQVSGLTNPTSPGSQSSWVTRFVDQATQAPSYGAVTNSISFGPQPMGWAATDRSSGSPSTHTFSFSPESTASLTGVQISVPAGSDALPAAHADLPGVAGNYLSTPDSIATSPLEELDLRVHASFASWPPSSATTLVSKYGASGHSYALRVLTDGRIGMYWYPTGTSGTTITAITTSSAPLVANSAKHLRVTLDTNTGAGSWEVRVSTSNDAVAWTPVGSVLTGATQPLFDSTSPTYVGSRGSSLEPFSGKIHGVEIRTSIDGASPVVFDPSAWTSGSMSGGGWTLTQAGLSPARILADLQASAVGLPTGAAQLSFSDSTLRYSFSATPVPARTPLSLQVDGLAMPAAHGTQSASYALLASTTTVDSGSASLYFTARPALVADLSSTAEDSPVDIDVLANDADADGNVTLSSMSISTPPANGSASVAAQKIHYVPAPDFHGADVFTYQVCDAYASCATSTASVTIASVNDLPTPQADSASTSEDASVSIDVLVNDSDLDGTLSPSSVTVITPSPSGTTSVDPSTGEITFSPASDFNGNAVFTYQVCDNEAGCAQAPVIVAVTSINDAPTANGDIVAVDEDTLVTVPVLSNDIDIDGSLDASTLVVVSPPAHGSASTAVGVLSYMPSAQYFGADALSYQVCDLQGLCATATVAFSVVAINDQPVAIDDVMSTTEDTPQVIDVLANDSDVEAALDPTTLEVLTAPASGALTVAAGVAIFTPMPDWSGIATFTYQVCDQEGACDQASLDVTVTSVNDAPRLVADTAVVVAGSTVEIQPLVNDLDVDSAINASSLTIGQGTRGTAVVAGASILYAADAHAWGADELPYQACDAQGACSQALVHLTVAAAPQIFVPNISYVAPWIPSTQVTTTTVPSFSHSRSSSSTTTPATSSVTATSIPEVLFRQATKDEVPRSVSSRIRIGDSLAPLASSLPGAQFSVASGSLPSGITLMPDGSFAGVALSGGSYSFRAQACAQAGCELFDLVVQVDAPADTNGLTIWIALGSLALVATSLVVLRRRSQ